MPLDHTPASVSVNSPASTADTGQTSRQDHPLASVAAGASEASGASLDALLDTYGAQTVPRYTSYPTAPHFAASTDDSAMRAGLSALQTGETVSVYVHIPFCREICWYCGCNMKLATRSAPITRYVDDLLHEIELAALSLPDGIKLGHLHFGGGSPSTLSSADLKRIMARLREVFIFTPQAELAIEIDPRTTQSDFIKTLAAEGFNRASLGIQEFDADVQAQINRIQPPDMVARVVEQLRSAGIASINFDILYGLPDQTREGLLKTIDLCLAMQPSRVALFGYAHVPWMAKRQRKIREENLPDTRARANQALAAADALRAAGYEAIGFDHFAKPGDSLAHASQQGILRRNFQGYTADPWDSLIGFGTTAISALPTGYIQNQSEITSWARLIADGALPSARAVSLTATDKLHRAVIMDLMCLRPVHLDQYAVRRGFKAEYFDPILSSLTDLIDDGLLTLDERTITITEAGRFFVRIVAARFDAYLLAAQKSEKRHSAAV